MSGGSMGSERSLLDTHVLIWAVADPRRLGEETRRTIAENRYAVSVATLWELIAMRDERESPVLDVATWWQDYVVKARTPVLPIGPAHLLYLERMPLHHRDPFDRILIAQAVVEKMSLITADSRLHQYGVTKSALE